MQKEPLTPRIKETPTSRQRIQLILPPVSPAAPIITAPNPVAILKRLADRRVSLRTVRVATVPGIFLIARQVALLAKESPLPLSSTAQLVMTDMN